MKPEKSTDRSNQNKLLSRFRIPANIWIGVILALILISLHLLSSATVESSHLNEMYSLLLVINVLGTIAMLGLVVFNVYSLLKQLKKHEAGSRLTIRMVFLFVLLALAPAGIVYYFSMQFLHQGIDSWFNVEIDRAMEDALELNQASLDNRMSWHLRQSQQMIDVLIDQSEAMAALEMENLLELSGATEITLLSEQGEIIASSSVIPGDILPSVPVDRVVLQLRQGKDYVGLDSTRDGKMIVQAVVKVGIDHPRYLQVLYPVPERIADLADSVEFAFVRYREMSFLRDSLKLSFSLVLSLVLLFSLLAAIWAAFISIRQIVAPVKELAKGTQAVAAGMYEQRLPVLAQDDLGFLVESFNQMVSRIAQAHDEAKSAHFEIESQRAYLETILANLTAGVISFDASFKIRTTNQAANRILHTRINRFSNQTLFDLSEGRPDLSVLVESMQQFLEQAEDVWQQRLAILGAHGRQELLFRGTPLYSSEGLRIGAVIVFDDITDLIQAQKNAAWGEVARRLAHEIKNPLTPIQLSAERMQHKLSDVLDSDNSELLVRATRTIVHQVEAMKRMVDDFSEYARPSKRQVEQVDMAILTQEILHLYTLQNRVEFKLNVDEPLYLIEADPVSIRQVLHNLIKNALEAIASEGEISIELHNTLSHTARFVEIAIYDNGTGISQQDQGTIFEPYVTNKTKGTGLGLAIVQKIIQEHGGHIWVDPEYQDGAGFIIQLPAA